MGFDDKYTTKSHFTFHFRSASSSSSSSSRERKRHKKKKKRKKKKKDERLKDRQKPSALDFVVESLIGQFMLTLT
jgi:hypothetical protein